MTGERISFEHCDVSALEIGGRRLPTRFGVAVWDIEAALPKDLPPLDGVLALDVFADQPFTLQLDAKTLTLESAISLERRVATMKRVQARIATGLSGGELDVFVRSTVDRPGWFLFDSGNLDDTRVASHMVKRSVAVPYQIESATLAVDGLPAGTVPLSVRELIYDGVLAEKFLRNWVWTFRLAGGELWACPTH